MMADMTISFEPLAARMRPENISEFIGQSHLTGKGKPSKAGNRT